MPTRPAQGASKDTWGDELEANLAVSIDRVTGLLVPAQVRAAIGGSQIYVPISGSDDAAVIAAGGQDIGLKVGTYKSNAGVTFFTQTRLEGRGMADATFGTWLTKITCNADGINAVTFNALGCVLKDFAVEYTGAGTATSGSGINAPLSSGMRVQDIAVKGFYDNFILGGFYWKASGLLSVDPVRAGIRVVNSVIDHGDAVIRDSFILAGTHSAAADGIRWEGGGGLKLRDNKVSAPAGSSFLNALNIFTPAGGVTSEITAAGEVYDQFTGKGVKIDTTAASSQLTHVTFNNCMLRGSANPTGGYYVRGTIHELIIQGGEIELGSNALSAFDIGAAGSAITKVTIDDVVVRGIPQANPIVTLDSTVVSANVRLGNLGPTGSTGGTAWSAGAVYLMHIGQQQGAQAGGSGEFNYTWKAPVWTSKVTYTSLWQLFMNGGCTVEFSLFAGITGVTPYFEARQTRHLNNNGGALAVTTVGTDSASSTDIDIQWRVSGKNIFIEAKFNSGTAGTTETAYSTVRITGIPNDVWAFS